VHDLGVYRGAANPGGVEAFGAWLGRPPAIAVDFVPWESLAEAGWWVDGWAGSGYRVVYSLPLLPDDGERFQRFARLLPEHGQDDALIRPGWEMNGDWYPWSIKDGAEAFAGRWRQAVSAMRAAAPGLEFDFTVNMGSSAGLDPAAAYPGDDYVDLIGMDVYDRGWESNLKMPFGLEWHRDFARAHDKRMSFPEWGLRGADAPEFVERMHAWIAQNQVAYHAYFDFEEHELANFPAAAERFRALFGAPS
jgi:hypothetical protein